MPRGKKECKRKLMLREGNVFEWRRERSAAQNSPHALRARLFHQKMGAWIGFRENAEAQNFGHYAGRFAFAVDAEIREAIRRNALRIQFAKAVFVTEERTAGHGHAAGKQ